MVMPTVTKNHVRDNTALLKMLGGDDQNPIPTETVWGADYTMWHTNLGQTVDSELISNLGSEGFERIKTQAHLSYGNAKGLQKNPLFIGAKLAFALDEGAGSESLNKLCTKILEFGTL